MDTKTKTTPQRPKRKAQQLQLKSLRYLNMKAAQQPKLGIASIELTEAYTRIDFNYTAPDYYVNGGWIQMHPQAYIRPVGTNTTYTLVKTINIKLNPSKTYFKHCGQRHTFTLFFPALPEGTEAIDIIEKEAPGTYFNFYNIRFSSWLKLNIPKSTFIYS